MTERGQWGSRLGFVLAAMGSAIGFGSISRFPMNVANNGGAAFLLVYAVLMLAIGIPMLVAEFSLGRASQRNVVGTFRSLEGNDRTRWALVGVFYVVVAGFFLSWYSVLAGWVLRYAVASFSGAYFAAPSEYLFDAVEGPDALAWHAVVMALTFLVLTTNVAKGIERVNLVMMPTLFAIVLALVVYAATLPGGAAGYAFYLTPDFSRVTVPVLAAVVGQVFFSLGVGMGGMMTYASYLPRGAALAKNATIISLSTLTFATVCGLMVFPMLSAFGLLGTGAAGLDLIFGPLPQAFARMGLLGPVVGLLFFVAVSFAAFTSAISLAEPGIAVVIEQFGVERRRAALLVCAAIYTVGIVAALSSGALGVMGGPVIDVALLLGGLFVALYVGWRSPAAKSRARMDESDEGWRLSHLLFPVVRWVMPGVLGLLVLFGIFGTPCLLSGGAAAPGLVGIFGGPALLGCP